MTDISKAKPQPRKTEAEDRPKSNVGSSDESLLSRFRFRPAELSGRGFAVLLGALVFVAFPQVLLGFETFFLRDFGLFVYPLAYYQRECFWHGQLPLWNPYNNCGVPFLAQWNTMPLYPPALIYLLLPLNWSLGFFDLLHLWFAGLGTYFLARRWTGNRLGASVAGLVFAFNGLSLNLLMWPSHMATLSWMPWVILAVERAWREGGRSIILAAAAGAMQMLAGGPETILLTWLLLLALFGAEQIGNLRHQTRVMQPGLRFGLMVLMVAALAAVQLLPFLDLAAHSQRERGYADTTWCLPARGWANFLVPMVFGSTWNQDVFFQYDQYWTSSYYAGIGTLLLAVLAVSTVRKRRVWLLAGAAGVAFIFALGDQTFVFPLVRGLVPQLTLMTYPVKFVTVILFAAPLLAAFGLSRLAIGGERDSIGEFEGVGRDKPHSSKEQKVYGDRPPPGGWDRRLWITASALLVLMGVILLWAWRFPRRLDDFPATLRNGLSRAGFLVGTIVVLTFLGRSGRLGRQGLLSLTLLLLFWFDLWTHEPNQNPTVTSDIYKPDLVRTELSLKPEPELGQARVMVSPAADDAFNNLRPKNLRDGYLAKRLGYFSNCNLLDQVPKVNGFFSLYPRESAALIALLYGSTNAFPHLEDFLSVAHKTEPGEFTKWAPRPSYRPWATAGQKPVFVEDEKMLTAVTAPDFDPSRVVILPASAKGFTSVTNQTDARVLKQQLSVKQVDLEVEANAPSLIVISQTYYHNWRAYVDGQPVPLFRANYAFQAVQVPEGRHELRLVYEDRAFELGAIISTLALLGCLAGWGRPRMSGV